MIQALVIMFFAALSLYAAGPAITELRPRGAEVGKAFTLTIAGRDLGEDAKVWSTLPASFTPVTTGDKKTVSFLVEPKSGVAPGVYPLRIETHAGMSNILLFTMGTFPEVMEEESQPGSKPNRNDTIETAEPVQSSPVTVNGTLRGPERDIFRVYGKAGERRIFEVEARRCGSAIDPVLLIFDGAGKQLARDNDTPGTGLDARLDFTFPSEGYYYVEVHDARFSTQGQNFYRLKMGAYTYADGVFPLGGRRGEQAAVQFFGPKGVVKSTVDLRNVAAKDRLTTVAMPDSPALPFLFAVSDLPELMEPIASAAPVPSVVNGRLEKEGEVDRFRYAVKPGDKLLIELQARELGTSHLEGIITVYDGAGKKLDSAGDKPLPEDVFAVTNSSRTSSDPYLNFTVPENVNEIVVSVEDLALRGGPNYGYRLITRRQAQDFRISIATPFVNVPAGGTAVINVAADRRGYDGAIQIRIPDLPKGLKAEGGIIPRETMDGNSGRNVNRRAIVTITAEPGVEMSRRELTVIGEGTLDDGTVLQRRASGTGLVQDVAGATAQGVVDRQRPITAGWLGLELPVAIGETPPATLEVKETSVKEMAEGARHEYAYKWTTRSKDVTVPARVTVEIIGAKDIRIIDMKAGMGKMSGTFAVTTTKATDPARYDLYLTGRVTAEGGDETIVSRPIPFEVKGSSGTNVASNQ
jgi:hypothetical protein